MYKKPFKYDEESQRVIDANGIDLCMMRGWADLNKALGANTALEVQDHWGGMIAHLLNENVGKDLPPKEQANSGNNPE